MKLAKSIELKIFKKKKKQIIVMENPGDRKKKKNSKVSVQARFP
jgi:hypothetical protein